jgi:hypothetical protein
MQAFMIVLGLCALFSLGLASIANPHNLRAELTSQQPSIYSKDSSYWTHSQLFENGAFTLKWKILPGPSIDIFMSISEQPSTPLWIAFGLGETGHMLGSDIVSVIYDPITQSAVADDRWVPWVASPLMVAPMPYPELDVHNDWSLKYVAANTTSLTAVVHRV